MIRRATRHEIKVWETKKKIIKECIKDLEREQSRKKKGKRQRKWRELLKGIGINKEQLRNEREAGNQIGENILKEMKRKEKEERQNKRQKINESRYNNKDII